MPNQTAATQKPAFSRREYDLRELLDEQCSYDEWKAASLSLERLNRLTDAYKPVLAFLERAAGRADSREAPLHIVDVGCGGGDTLRTIYKWSQKRGMNVRLTGIDVKPYAARLAQERDREAGLPVDAIHWIIGDIFTWRTQQPPGLILSSLLAHHLGDLELLSFLQWCERTSTIGWLTVDLVRSEGAARWAGLLVTLLGMHRFIRHDTPVSFRRALSREEWEILLGGGGLARARMVDAGRGKIAVESFKQRSASDPAPST